MRKLVDDFLPVLPASCSDLASSVGCLWSARRDYPDSGCCKGSRAKSPDCCTAGTQPGTEPLLGEVLTPKDHFLTRKIPLIGIHQCPPQGLIGSVQTGGRWCLSVGALAQLSVSGFLPEAWQGLARPAHRSACVRRRTLTWRRWWRVCPGLQPTSLVMIPWTVGLRHLSWNSIGLRSSSADRWGPSRRWS